MSAINSLASATQQHWGRTVTWRVTKVAQKVDALDYVELEAINEPLQKKMLSVRALSDVRMFSRVQS